MPRLKALAHFRLSEYMVGEQVLDGMTREQLISLLYSTLRRLLVMPQTATAPTDPIAGGQAVDGGLIIDPTIDAWQDFNLPLREVVGPLTISRRDQYPSLGVWRGSLGPTHILQMKARHALPSVGRGNQAILCRSCPLLLLEVRVVEMRMIPGLPQLNHLSD